MKYHRLGNSELNVSALSLGCMSLGTDKKHASNIISAALEQGINYFDTADLYEFGMNEEIVGRSLKGVRDEVILATKVGNRWNEEKDHWNWDPSKKYIKEAVKSSLQRLQTDYIDLYQLHGGMIEDSTDETIEAFEELKQEGYVRYYGISSIRPNVIDAYLKKSNIISIMMQYSILDRRPEETIFPLLNNYPVSVVTRGPVAKGLLTEKYVSKITEKGYLTYSETALTSLLTSLHAFAKESGRTLLEVALQYNLAATPVASVVTGASSVEQLIANAKALDAAPLTSDELQFIQQLSQANVYEAHRMD